MLSENTNDALTAIITVDSLIIGFIGAMLPVVMSMKNNSEIIRDIFRRDKDKLFLSYIKQTLLIGIILIIVAITFYFRDQYVETYYYKLGFPLCIYFLVCFLLCTYRCLNNMLNLIFSNDDSCKKDDYNVISEEEVNFKENMLKKQKEAKKEWLDK